LISKNKPESILIKTLNNAPFMIENLKNVNFFSDDIKLAA